MLPDKRDVTVEECIAMLLLLNEEHMLAGTATGASVAKAIGVFAGDLAGC